MGRTSGSGWLCARLTGTASRPALPLSASSSSRAGSHPMCSCSPEGPPRPRARPSRSIEAPRMRARRPSCACVPAGVRPRPRRRRSAPARSPLWSAMPLAQARVEPRSTRGLAALRSPRRPVKRRAQARSRRRRALASSRRRDRAWRSTAPRRERASSAILFQGLGGPGGAPCRKVAIPLQPQRAPRFRNIAARALAGRCRRKDDCGPSVHVRASSFVKQCVEMTLNSRASRAYRGRLCLHIREVKL